MSEQAKMNAVKRITYPGMVMYFDEASGKHSIATFPEGDFEYSAVKGGYLDVKVDELEKWVFMD